MTNYNRKYEINEKYFEIESENMAYILGLFWSDGSIIESQSGTPYEFNITQKDEEELLEKIRIELGSTLPLKRHEKTGSYVLKVFSIPFCEKLINIGATPRKSLTLSWPKLSDKYISSFIRGYFDGDGCIHQKKEGPIISTIACGSRKFLEELQFKLHTINPDINAIIIDSNETCFNLIFNQFETLHLGHIMYNFDKMLFIKRKFDLFVKLSKKLDINKPTTRAKLTFDNVEEILIRAYNYEFTTIKQISDEYKVHRSTIDQIFNKVSWMGITDNLQVPLTEVRNRIKPRMKI